MYFRTFKYLFKPWNLLHICFWIRESVIHRNFLFFLTTNSSIYLSGMLNERKSDIYNLLPTKLIPNTEIVGLSIPNNKIKYPNLKFPLILKPNIGFAGNGVLLINSKNEFKEIVSSLQKVEYLAQEYINSKKEYSILAYNNERLSGYNFSIVEKLLPSVIGDGVSTLRELIYRNKSNLRINHICQRFSNELDTIPQLGHLIEIDYVGAVSKGAIVKLLDVNVDKYEIADQLTSILRNANIDVARIDVKADSLSSLLNNEYRILEINGSKSEPLEIYCSELTILKRIGILSMHWKKMGAISKSKSASYFTVNNGISISSKQFFKNLNETLSIISTLKISTY